MIYVSERRKRPSVRTSIICMGTDNSIDHRDKSDIAELNKNMLHLPALRFMLQEYVTRVKLMTNM